MSLPRDLGDGLVMRWARRDDAGQLAEFNATMQADVDVPAAAIADWTLDLFELSHPTFRVEEDWTVVEDTARGRIVSTMCLLQHVWSYAGVPVPVGQPELVATDPYHRRRGLVRAQCEAIHQRSAAIGHLWQWIGGIPWFYRQFGYTYALDSPPSPAWFPGESPPARRPGYSVRPARASDVPALARLEVDARREPVLGCVRGLTGWELELSRRPGALPACQVLVVEHESSGSSGPRPVGYVAHQRHLRDGLASVLAFELLPGHGWLEPTATVLAHLHDWVRCHPSGPGRGVRLELPAGHPALQSAATRLGQGPGGSAGWYVRVPDHVAFVRAVAPVLEARVAASPAVGYSGVLRIDLYTDELQLSFQEGQLTAVERVASSSPDSEVDASVPAEGFVHLLLGNRPLSDVERTMADCELHTDAGALLLDVLFPPIPLCRWTTE